MSEEISSHSSSPTGSTGRFWATIVAVLAVGVGAAAYAIHERSLVKQLTAQNDAVTSTLNTTRDQVSTLNSRLDAMSAAQQSDKAGENLASHQLAGHPFVYRKGVTAASTRHRMEDPRWKKMQGQLDDQAKQIESTRQDLASARTDLQGSIATTHDELVLLEKKGDRNYYEFDLDKSAQFQRQGSVGIRLRKANTKHEYADLELLVDDFKVSKKHVNIFEPVVSYSGDRRMPVELVINTISKNHIHGYVSEPKYKSAELEAMAKPVTADSATGNSSMANASVGNSAANNTAAAGTGTGQATTTQAKPSPVRQKLTPPSN